MCLQCDLALALADGPGEVVLADLAGDGDGYVGVDRTVVCADVDFG